MHLDKLVPTSKRGLWAAFFIFVALNAGFLIVMKSYGFSIIDEMWRPDQILSHIADMSPEQRRAHAWMTSTLDVAYPLTYAALFGGLTIKAFPHKAWLALPILICVLVDLVEGVSQVMLLNGHESWVGLKSVVTPVKLILFITGVVTAIAALWVLYKSRNLKPD